MVISYLEKTKEEFFETKASLNEQLVAVQNHYKETLKMIQLLEDNNDPNYESFTPREVNSYNKTKLKELIEEQKELTVQLQNLRTCISDVDCKIEEIVSVIKVAKGDFSSTLDSNLHVNEVEDDLKIVVLESVEGERQRIARDLHDTTVQNLTSLVHKSEMCMKLIDIDPIRCKLELSTLGKTLRDTINDTRKMIYDLRPMSFDDIGFDVTVERALDKFKQVNNVNYSFNVTGDEFNIPSIISITLLRIIQETCSNSVKHGKCSNIDVQLNFKNDSVELCIKDDGCGFDVATLPKETRKDNSGFGYSMMKESIFLLSGTMNIESSVGNGCLVKVVIPIKKEDNKDGN